MYREGHPGYGLKYVILKLLLIILLIFIIIWLFPTKNYIKNLIDQKLGTSTNINFTNNLNNMKAAATNYFTGVRLPEKEGQAKTLTLRQMVDQNLLVDFNDKNGDKCNYEKSYAKVVKNKVDYTLNVNLVCKSKQSKVKSYICVDGLCEKKKITDSETPKEIITKENVDDNKNKEEQQETKTEEKKEEIKTEEKKESKDSEQSNKSNTKECEYSKTTGGYWTNYGNWSAWTDSYVNSSDSRQVESKVETIKTGTVVEQSGTTKHTQNPKKVIVTRNGKKQIVYVCPSDFDNGGSYNTAVTCVKTIPNYVNKDTYKKVTYYRFRDRNYIKGNTSYKWSICNDQALIKNGYKTTGKTK